MSHDEHHTTSNWGFTLTGVAKSELNDPATALKKEDKIKNI